MLDKLTDWYDLASLHNTVFDLTGKQKSDNELNEIWRAIPDDLKMDAEKWGCSDTVVREDIYEFLEYNIGLLS